MRNALASKLDKKSRWLALALGGVIAALSAQSCSVDKSKYTFDDAKFAGVSGNGDPNGGASGANGGGAHAGSSSGGDAGDGTMNGGSANGGANGVCTPGDHACSADGHLQTCVAGTPPAFDVGKACGGDGLCSASRATCLKCVPGEFQCVGNVLRQCDLSGSVFEDSQTCDSKTACVADGQKGYCVRCKAGANSCESTAVHVLAAPDEKTSYPANRLLTCNAEGSGTDTSAVCEAESSICDPVKKCLGCQPNAFFCSGSSVNKCNADGMNWTSVTYCNQGTVCDAAQGKCVIEPGCTPGSYQCSGKELQACRHGKFETLDTCESGTTCDANNGRCQVCVPNTSSCVNGNVQACDYNYGQGTPFTLAQCNPGTCTPNGSNNADCGTCRPGSIRCYDGSVGYSLCAAGGGQTPQSCPKDTQGNQLVCSSALQKCAVCVPGRATCDAVGTLKKCLDDGSGWKTEDCGQQYKCDAGRAQCIDERPGNFWCSPEGNLMKVGYTNHLPSSTLVQKCGSLNLCDQGAGLCREKSCVVGQLTCNGADVYTCDAGNDHRTRTGTRCSSTARCQDGFGCVKVLALAAGDAHTCAIVAGMNAVEGDPGYTLCWGANESGQLGDGSPLLADSKEPRQVLVAGDAGLPPRLSNYMTGLSAGKNFTCADIAGGDGNFVVCWGSNLKGQLGVPGEGLFNAPFDAVGGSGNNQKPPDLRNVTCGAEFACALGPDGAAWCWGSNENGQLGNGSTMPAGPTAIAGHTFLQLTAGANHVCGVKADNSVWCWGDGALGQLGNLTKKDWLVPTQVLKVAAVADRPLALGGDFTLALGTKANKNPFSWGTNSFGQLANGTLDDSAIPTPLSGLLTADLLSIAGTVYSGATARHACARLGDRLFCWGANVFGEVGDGTSEDRPSPVSIFDGKTDATKLAPGNHSVAVGGRHTCAITAKGDVLCWGANHRYQLGTAAISPQRSPAKAY